MSDRISVTRNALSGERRRRAGRVWTAADAAVGAAADERAEVPVGLAVDVAADELAGVADDVPASVALGAAAGAEAGAAFVGATAVTIEAG